MRPGGPTVCLDATAKTKISVPTRNQILFSGQSASGLVTTGTEQSSKCATVYQFTCMTCLKTWQICLLVQNI
jgi:hypothetical protein